MSVEGKQGLAVLAKMYNVSIEGKQGLAVLAKTKKSGIVTMMIVMNESRGSTENHTLGTNNCLGVFVACK